MGPFNRYSPSSALEEPSQEKHHEAVAMRIKARRSMPSLRLPISRSASSTSFSPVSDPGHLERPHPLSPSRKSVSSMKSLLPLKLHSSPPMPNISVWLDGTSQNSQVDAKSPSFLPKPVTSDDCYIPWMLSPQNSELFSGAGSGCYRETPIYSEPGSPTLSRAYYSDGELNENFRTSWSNYSSLNSYVQEPHDGPYSETSSHIGSDEVFPQTGLPQCCGNLYKDLDGHEQLIIDQSRDALGFITCHTLQPAFEEKNTNNDRILNDWINDESSRCSSPMECDEILDALATPLAPAKAHMIHVCSDLAITPKQLEQHKPSIVRPPTPFRARPSGKDSAFSYAVMDSPLPSPSSIAISVFECPRTPPPNYFMLSTPPTTPPKNLIKAEEDNHSQRHMRKRKISPEPNEDGNALPFLEDIIKAIGEFPREILSLDTPCVKKIRQHNLEVKETSTQHNIPSSNLPLSRQPLDSHFAARRQAEISQLFAPLQVFRSEEPAKLNVTSTAFDRCPEAFPSHGLVEHECALPPADLRPLQRVFPDTSDSWRNILYAQLVVYTYLRDFPHSLSRRQRWKILRRPAHGMSHAESMSIANSLDEIFPKLEAQITRIIHVVANTQDVAVGYSTLDGVQEVDLTAIRALAEIVSSCEQVN